MPKKIPTLEQLEEMKEMYDYGENPGFCSSCGEIIESGFEPDAENYDCENCGGKKCADGLDILLIRLI